MNTYIAFLRGINVGGKNLIKMTELKDALTASGLGEVQTFIQSGNIIFSSVISDTDKLAAAINIVIRQKFKLEVDVTVFSKNEWQRVIKAAPKWWGTDKTKKHNILIMIRPYQADDVFEVIGELKPDIEAIEVGEGVLYQSLSVKKFGHTTASKLVASPNYKKLTIRNYNTATKLLALLD